MKPEMAFRRRARDHIEAVKIMDISAGPGELGEEAGICEEVGTMPEKKILVIDGETAILSIIKEAFKAKGYLAVTAESAEMAYRILSKETFVVIFLELKLPGMSGLELCRRIRRDDQEVIIYAITSLTDFGNVTDCRSAGFDNVFLKPISLNVLLKAAEDGFERAGSGKSRESDLCNTFGKTNYVRWCNETG